WDPVARGCATVWANPDVSVPNGIPTYSAVTNLVYGIGRSDGAWGLVGLDFDTGEQRLWAPSENDCSSLTRESLGLIGMIPDVVDALDADPQACENSVYAATTVGPDGIVYTGTLAGVSRYVPD